VLDGSGRYAESSSEEIAQSPCFGSVLPLGNPSILQGTSLNEEYSLLHQCHFCVEGFGFLPPADESLAFGLFVVLDGRRGGGGGVGGFGALDLVFPGCQGVAFFDADSRDCTVT